MRRLWVSLCVCMVLACTSMAHAITYYGDFDWRIYSGPDYPAGNYVTGIRNQGSDGSCWAHSAIAAVESRFLLDAGTPGVELNLSEEHLNCDASTGMGGHEDLALKYIRDVGVVDEATLPYITGVHSPLWPLDKPYTVYKITSVDTFCTGGYTSTSELKSWLENYGPLSCAINTGDLFNPDSLYNESIPEMDDSIPEWFQGESPSGGVIGPNDPVGGIDHSVCLVGYKDVPSMTEGGYWIIKNSWGTGWRDDGFGFLKYGDIEKHSRIHAIDGSTYTEIRLSTAPVANNDSYTVNEDSRDVYFMYQGVRANDTDLNTPVDQLTVETVSNPVHGTIELGENGAFRYIPDAHYFGSDYFRYRLFDGTEYSNVATVSIDVISVNDAPIAVDDYYTCEMNSLLITYPHNGLLVNDSDADNYDYDTEHDDTLSVIVQSDVSHGTITWYSGGSSFRYIPDYGFTGIDSVTYKVFDGTVLSNLATVFFEVVPSGGSMPVPEPSVLVLLAMGLLSHAMTGRRRLSR